jgi:hypothetical protein
VIYLHDITQEGWTRSSQTNLDLFFKLCGEEAMTQVSIVATKWDKISTRLDEGTERLKELKNDYWKHMIQQDASVCILQPDVSPDQRAASEGSIPPWGIIHRLVSSMDGRSVVLQIQTEIVKLEKELGETEAGKELRRKLEELLADAKKTRRELKIQPSNPMDLSESQRKIEAIREDLVQLVPSTRKAFLRWVRGKWQSGKAAVGFKG